MSQELPGISPLVTATLSRTSELEFINPARTDLPSMAVLLFAGLAGQTHNRVRYIDLIGSIRLAGLLRA